MYGSARDIKHNLTLFFIDGVVFTPSMTLISVTAVIPYFLARLGASTFQIALAASIALVCNFVAQPFFGYVATHSQAMHRTFGKILLLQRVIFLVFVLCIPLLAKSSVLLVWSFLFFWGVFNIFVGSYNVFHTPLLIKLLPPDKRGAIRGIGFAIGSGLGLGAAALIPVILGRIAFPYNYTLIFSLGIMFLFMDAVLFFFMRQNEHVEPNMPMNITQYLKEMPFSIRNDLKFRTMIFTCMFLVVANSLLSYYTLYAIRVFSATDSHIATLAALAVLSNAFGYVFFGALVDRRGPVLTTIISAALVIAAGAVALVTRTLGFLFAAWVFANLGSSSYGMSVALLLGEVSPPGKLPLYVGVHTTISLALSSAVLLLLAPVLESAGFMLLFAIVFACGVLSFVINLFALQKRIRFR